MDASLASTISAIGNTSTSHRANELVSDLKKKKKKNQGNDNQMVMKAHQSIFKLWRL